MMAAMEIRTTLTFPADPRTVFTMLVDPGFLEEVAAEAGTRDARVTVNGNRTISQRTLDAPAQAEKIIGPDITVIEELTWGPARPDGSRTGALTLTCLGQPVTMTGTVDLQPGGSGTLVTVSGDLAVKIPLVGKKLEKLAAPAIYDGIQAEERVGLRRLART
jgi:uncharacterized protein YndB with AHSA1/START domain